MRAGLTGLGVVFLITLAAAVAFGPSAGDPVTKQQVKAQGQRAPGEPLAQLGVAPGLEKDPDTAMAAAAPPAGAPAAGAPAAPPGASESPMSAPAPAGPLTPEPGLGLPGASAAGGRPVAT